MGQYIIRRIGLAVPMLFILTIVSFMIIQAPPGDFLTSYIAALQQSGEEVAEEEIEALKLHYGLDQPLYMQYFKWMRNIVLRGNFGVSLVWERPVSDIIWERMALTLSVASTALVFAWIIAIPVGIFSAVKQYSIFDYLFTGVGFLGLATPNFLVALVVLWTIFVFTGDVLSGLFSPEFVEAPWSLAKIIDLLKHLWLPGLIVGTSETAYLIRVMRNNLLDELNKPYVEAARARGASEWRLILKYPVRLAFNPFISTVGWSLPQLLSGGLIVAIVLSLPTAGPLLLGALLAQDMFLAGAFILMLSVLTIIGTLLSDVLLAWQDPRIRMEER